MMMTYSLTQIQYTLITSESSFSESHFHNKTFRLLKEFPKDLLQLESTVDHFDFSFHFALKKGLELFSLPDTFFNIDTETAIRLFHEYSNEFNNSLIKIFIIDHKIESHKIIAKFVHEIPHTYFTIIDCPEDILNQYKTENYFTDGNSLIALLKNDRKKITEIINERYPEGKRKLWEINKEQTFFHENKLLFSNLIEANYFVLNQIIGNFWIEDYSKFNDDNLIKHRLLPNQRVAHILSQSKTIDGFTKVMFGEKVAKPVSPFNPVYSTLILIAPFHFPRLDKLLNKKKLTKNEKAILKVYKSEQQLDYCFQGDESAAKILKQEEIAKILVAMNQRLLFLDDVGYLHALFSYSPVIRLPLIGKSINMDLSHLENFISTRKKAVNKILKFGYDLSQLVLEDRIKDYISNRDGQIAVISDLPIEWLYLDGYPLCYTHDVCRIPEYNQNGIVNNYFHNQRYNYVVRDNLIEKTLVIHCASKNDVPMEKMFQLIDSYKNKFGFNSIHCSTINEIKEAVNSYQPELLIFDCHGGFDKDTLSSYLIIDSENKIYLTGNDIIENNISAPLVLLSACSTMPNYGYVKFLSDAFMEVGSFCVTATFMPLSINDAAILIIRLLGKLVQCKNKVIHSNLLEFISHVLRTTLIHETIRKEKMKNKTASFHIDDEEIAAVLTETMIFSKRKDAIKKLNILLKKWNSNFEFNFENLNNEWMSYTIIGRADLLYFENWITKYRELNMNFDKEDKNNNT